MNTISLNTNRIDNNKARNRQEKKSFLCFFLPSFGGVLLFYVLPFLVIIFYSFINNPIDMKFVGLANYSELMNNDIFKLAVRNTFIFSVTSVPLSVAISLLLAVIVDSEIKFKSQVKAAFICPLMVPTASIVLVFQVLFHKLGTLNQFLSLFNIESVDWLRSEKGLVVVSVMFLWKNLGYNMILFIAGMSNIPKDLLEVAILEGAGSLYKFFHIKLRYLSPTIFFVTILSIINSFKIFREVYLLTGDYPNDSLYMLQHFMNNTFNLFEYQKLSSAAIILSVAMIVIVGVLIIIESIIGKDVE